MFAAFEKMVDFLWGVPLIVVILGTGLVLTIRSKFFQFAHLGLILKSVMHKGKGKQETKESLTPFQALCIAVGGCVGVSNISGHRRSWSPVLDVGCRLPRHDHQDG